MTLAESPSKRLRHFREDLIKNIPRSPNNAESLAALNTRSLGELLIIYFNNAAKYVPPRPRAITVEPAVTADPRWKDLASEARTLLEKARTGEDLTPNLSLRIHKQGFTLPLPTNAGDTPEKWIDKDFLLNVMGYHHFHLSHMIEEKGHAKRTQVVLVAQITRNTFEAIGFFDHSVFDANGPRTNQMNSERTRLWTLFENRSRRGVPPGAAYAPWSISTSGHNSHHVLMASRYARTIALVDPKLDDREFLRNHFRQSPNDHHPEKYRLRWRLEFLDLGIYEELSNVFCVAENGPI